MLIIIEFLFIVISKTTKLWKFLKVMGNTEVLWSRCCQTSLILQPLLIKYKHLDSIRYAHYLKFPLPEIGIYDIQHCAS